MMETNVEEVLDPRLLGARLQEARKARRLTQERVAEELGLKRTTVVAIEKGDRRVRPEELMLLADLYGREVADLTRRRAVTQGFAAQFRLSLPRDGGTRGDGGVDEDLSVAGAGLQGLCEDYFELERLCSAPLTKRYPHPYDMAGARAERAAEDIASAERNRLGLGDGPLLNLRALLENDVGLRIFFMPMASRIGGLFGYTDELGGCVAINARHPDERRRWSLAHEYAHFLTNRYHPDVAVVFVSGRVPAHERFADAFARCFLMPASGLGRRIAALRQSKRDGVTTGDLLALADLYRVSFAALILRLEELRFVALGTWERLRSANFKVREAQAKLGLVIGEPARDEELLPTRYRYLAVEAYERELLTEGELARYLRTDLIGAREAVERLRRRPDVGDAGDIVEMPMTFSTPVELA